MDYLEFLNVAMHTGAALLMGAALGFERQYGGHPAGLRTNALVSVGAALFVSLSYHYAHTTGVDPTRIPSYVISGLGFLGGGVILREGFNVRGLNTAATLWCTGAIGTLCGLGFMLHAVVGAVVVLLVNVVLRPVAVWIDVKRATAINVETGYRLRAVCAESDQTLVRTIVIRHINSQKAMIVRGIALANCERANHIAVTVEITAHERNDRAMEEVVTRLNIEPGVVAVSWERMQ
jgi:putative Mg2+ transporter-C (MgtC) family protein